MIKFLCQSSFGIEVKTETKKWTKLVREKNIQRATILSFFINDYLLKHSTTDWLSSS